MTETRAVTCTLELHAYLTEQAQVIRRLREQVEEKERTNELHVQRIIELQRKVAALEHA